MFLAAAPYFQHRFRADQWILSHFQSAITSVSCVMNLVSIIVLTKLQRNTSYPRRITTSLLINSFCFILLSLSTLLDLSATIYFAFLMVMVLSASLSAALIQNGLFAYVSGYGKSEYTQAIMTGQAVAGVLPPLAEMISVAVVSSTTGGDDPPESSTSALIYFLTATAVSINALVAFFYLQRRRDSPFGLRSGAGSARKSAANSAANSISKVTAPGGNMDSNEDGSHPEFPRATIPVMTLFRKLPFLSSGVFVCFAVTMVFPVFTSSITSVSSSIPPTLFIPLAFLVWNAGDLLGRVCTLYSAINFMHYPFALFCLAMARLLFIPLYFLCNVRGQGAVIQSDLFYLAVVQFLFGFSNGYIGSNCMMGAGMWVHEDEREAAGGFMGLSLVSGLAAGALLSFLLGDL